MRFISFFTVAVFLFFSPFLCAQQLYELHTGWTCAKMTDIKINGSAISNTATDLQGWQPAVVPGTVLTTLLANKKIPDPFYGMNNELIQDIYTAGKDQDL